MWKIQRDIALLAVGNKHVICSLKLSWVSFQDEHRFTNSYSSVEFIISPYKDTLSGWGAAQDPVRKSGSQLVFQKVKWAYTDVYLWQTMWKHAKKINGKAQMSNFSVFTRGYRWRQELFHENGCFLEKLKRVLPMWKSTSSAFRICMTHGALDDLSHSYWVKIKER